MHIFRSTAFDGVEGRDGKTATALLGYHRGSRFRPGPARCLFEGAMH
jgi:hypothetical protein